jgi:hypothetical protein
MPRRPAFARIALLAAVVASAPLVTATAAEASVAAVIAPYSAGSLSDDGSADLDGDRLGDIVQKTTDGSDTTFGVRRSSDGHLLWQHTTQLQIAHVRVLRVGQPARPGLLVETFTSVLKPGTNPSVYDETVQLLAYDGRTGQQLWQWQRTGQHQVDYASPDVKTNLPEVVGVLPGAVGKNSSVLVSITTDSVSRALVVSGSDGSAKTIGTPPPRTQIARVGLVGDLDGDGHGDVGLTYEDRNIETRSSTTGALIWARLGVMTASYQLTVQRLAVTTGGTDAVLVHNDKDTVLNGNNGHLIATLSRGFTQPMGDADGDGMADTLTHGTNYSSTAISESFEAFSSRTGKLLWKRSVSIPRSDFSGYTVRVTEAGDVQPDGARDFYVEMYKFQGSNHTVTDSRFSVVSGHDGSVTNGQPLGTPLRASIDAKGDDFALVTANQSLKATVYDGQTRTVVWTYQRSAPSPINLETYLAAQFTADQRADLLLVTDTGGTTKLSLVDGATHTVRWAVVG